VVEKRRDQQEHLQQGEWVCMGVEGSEDGKMWGEGASRHGV